MMSSAGIPRATFLSFFDVTIPTLPDHRTCKEKLLVIKDEGTMASSTVEGIKVHENGAIDVMVRHRISNARGIHTIAATANVFERYSVYLKLYG